MGGTQYICIVTRSTRSMKVLIASGISKFFKMKVDASNIKYKYIGMYSPPEARFLPTYGIVSAVPACNTSLASGRKPLRTAAA